MRPLRRSADDGPVRRAPSTKKLQVSNDSRGPEGRTVGTCTDFHRLMRCDERLGKILDDSGEACKPNYTLPAIPQGIQVLTWSVIGCN